jgi:hypothetical protein
MPMSVNIVGRVRKLLEGIDASAVSDEEQLTLTAQLEQLIAASASPYQEIVRMGRSFQVTTTTAVAAGITIPSTAGGLSLYNNEPDGGRSYVIDFISANGVATAAASGCAALIALQGQVREAIPTNSALIAKKLNGLGGGTNDTKARTILTGTALPAGTGIAADWFFVGAGIERARVASFPGGGLYWAAEGRVICPPGRYFSMQVIADTAASTFQLCIAWHEKQLLLA